MQEVVFTSSGSVFVTERGKSLVYKPDGTAARVWFVPQCACLKQKRLVLSLSSSNRRGLLPAAFDFLQGSGLFSLVCDVLADLVSSRDLYCLC